IKAGAHLWMPARAVTIANHSPVIAAVLEKEQPARPAEHQHRMAQTIVAIPIRFDPALQRSVGSVQIARSRKEYLVPRRKPRAKSTHATLVSHPRRRSRRFPVNASKVRLEVK